MQNKKRKVNTSAIITENKLISEFCHIEQTKKVMHTSKLRDVEDELFIGDSDD